MSDQQLTKEQVQSVFLAFVDQDAQQAMSLIGGLWLQLNIEYLKQNGYEHEGRIDIETGTRDVTIWPHNHQPD